MTYECETRVTQNERILNTARYTNLIQSREAPASRTQLALGYTFDKESECTYVRVAASCFSRGKLDFSPAAESLPSHGLSADGISALCDFQPQSRSDRRWEAAISNRDTQTIRNRRNSMKTKGSDGF